MLQERECERVSHILCPANVQRNRAATLRADFRIRQTAPDEQDRLIASHSVTLLFCDNFRAVPLGVGRAIPVHAAALAWENRRVRRHS